LKVLGVITARGGSKGIPGKNLKLLAGKPLIAYTIEAARESSAFDRVVLSTDAGDIADAARSLGCDVPFMRPADLARDDTPHLPVLQHAVQWFDAHEHYRPDAVMVLQPTSPFRQARHIQESIALLDRSDADSVVSVSEAPPHFNPMRMLRVDDRGMASLFVSGMSVRFRINRRQDLPAAWTINGAIYLFRTWVLSATEPSLYGETTAAYVMPETDGINLDSIDDWAEAERVIAARENGDVVQAFRPAPRQA
jgi:CMP-N,N'-diacetyllegionaminic acid synthase